VLAALLIRFHWGPNQYLHPALQNLEFVWPLDGMMDFVHDSPAVVLNLNHLRFHHFSALYIALSKAELDTGCDQNSGI